MPSKKKGMNIRDRAEQELITIRGLIIPYEWDEKGNVIAISISTFQEEEYLIDEDKQSDQLLALIRQLVEISGVVRREDGRKRMKVKECRMVPLSKKGGFER